MSATGEQNRRKYGPQIVRRWFDTIFPYVLGRLDSERPYLARRNWSYRFYKRSLDYIARLGEFMPATERANLEQYALFFPEVTSLVEEHDRGVGELTAACRAFHEAIMRNSGFRQTLASVQAESEKELGVEFSSHFGALSEAESFAGLLAEYLVNNLEELPGYYSTARLWNGYRDRLAMVLSAPEIEVRRLETDASGRELLQASDTLTAMLKSNRFELSLELDLPVA